MQQKKALKLFGNEKEQFVPQPSISNRTKVIAERKRKKLGIVESGDIVEKLLDPNANRPKQERLERLRKTLRDKENKEMTFKPKIINVKLETQSKVQTGNKNLDLYNMALNKPLKNDIPTDEVEFQKSRKECKFKPDTYKPAPKPSHNAPTIKGMDKLLSRLQKGREEHEFKRAMTERSNFTPAQGISKAR